MRSDLAQSPESPCSVRFSLMVTGEIEGLTGEPDRIRSSVGQSIRLAQVGEVPDILSKRSERLAPLDPLLEKQQPVGQSSGEDTRIAQVRKDSGGKGSDVPCLREFAAAIEEMDRFVGSGHCPDQRDGGSRGHERECHGIDQLADCLRLVGGNDLGDLRQRYQVRRAHRNPGNRHRRDSAGRLLRLQA